MESIRDIIKVHRHTKCQSLALYSSAVRALTNRHIDRQTDRYTYIHRTDFIPPTPDAWGNKVSGIKESEHFVDACCLSHFSFVQILDYFITLAIYDHLCIKLVAKTKLNVCFLLKHNIGDCIVHLNGCEQVLILVLVMSWHAVWS